MHTNKQLSVFFLLFFAFSLSGQSRFWTQINESGLRSSHETRHIIPKKYLVYNLDYQSLIKTIQSENNRSYSVEFDLDIPQPDGTFKNYRMVETPVFSKELQSKYPGFTSFTGRGIENGNEYLKMSISPYSVSIMILNVDGNTVFIDPYYSGSTDSFVVYYKSDYEKSSKSKKFFCGVNHETSLQEDLGLSEISKNSLLHERQPGDCNFRTYRLALACTGEYSQFHGGTIEKVLDAYNVAMTRVNGVYEKDVAITMVLVADTDKLIFLNASTDPYSNNNGSAMLSQNQTTINNIIGFNNYDIGHVFSTGGGGVASLGSPCTNRKAQGVTGQASPINDPFTIDYVAHEMGHQFGANHTQNNSCQRSSSTAMEPGSGSTIMGYAGICDPNVQNNSHDYFHAVSLGEIANFVTTGAGATCGVLTPLDNSKPLLSISRNSYSMPVGTSFYLTADGFDADGDVLTYTWEQMDNQTATMPPAASNASGPAFRSLPPSTNPTRYFRDLLGRYNTWEVLPSISRTMRFRCTVRDNNPLGGCSDEVNVQLNFTNTAGPFVVTYPNTSNVEWRVGTTQNVTWNVANTNIEPINCNLVSILLSSDGGATYPDTLARAVPNTGSYEVSVPNRLTTRARIMVIADDHIIFDISNANFRISSSFNITTPSAIVEICDESLPAEVVLNMAKFVSSDVTVNLSATSGVEGLTFNFSENNPSAPSTVIMSVGGLENLEFGDNTVVITATTNLEIITLSLSLFRSLDELPVLVQNLPANYANLTSRFNVLFECTPVTGILEYEFEISVNPDFSGTVNRLKSTTGRVNITLADRTVYYWRVRPLSVCADGQFTGFYTFRTGAGGPAVLLNNKQILINPGEIREIGQKELDAPGTPTDLVRFVVTELPHFGLLSIGDSIIINPGFIFTLDDITNGLLQYRHDGGEDEYDSFIFNLINPAGLWLPNNRFNIRIRQSILGIEAFTASNVRCHGESSGQIFADVFGGTPPYSYSLDGVMYGDESILEMLPKGNYSVFVQDATETIVKSDLVNIDEPSQLILSLEAEGYNIRAKSTGGVAGYVYSLNGEEFTSNNLFLDPGNQLHIIELMDRNGCIATDSISIDIPVLEVEVLSGTALCPGDKIEHTLVATGGIPPYNYSYNGNPFSSSNIFALASGVYVFEVRDTGNKILLSDTIITSEPDALTANVEIDRYLASFTASGGTGDHGFSLDGELFDTINFATFDKSGSYLLFIKDEMGCIGTKEFLINVLDTAYADKKDLNCFGIETGQLFVTVPYGTPPFTYTLVASDQSIVQSDSSVIDQLPAGIYTLTVADALNDSYSLIVEIIQPEPLELNTSTDGSTLFFSAEGGTPPYAYSIDDGINYFEFDVFPDLPDNLYKVAVKDQNGCIEKKEVSISVSTENQNVSSIFSIYPNPTKGMFTFRFPQVYSENNSITILNSLGQIVFSKVLNPSETNRASLDIDLNSVPVGSYVLRYNNGLNINTFSIIKIE